MTTARGTALADAVVAELLSGARPWNSSALLVAARDWLPVHKPADVQVMKVSVATLTLESVKLKRPGQFANQETYGTLIDFQVAASFTNDVVDSAPLDAADFLAQQIADFYGDAHQLTAAGTTWTVMNRTRLDLYDLRRLYRDSVWETLIALVIRGYVA